MSNNAILQTVHAYVETLVHPSARTDALTATRHRAFIATRLLGGLVALAILPVHLALRGAPTPLEAVVFAGLVSPLLAAWFLARTGAYERAHLLSAVMLAGLIALVAGLTGGITSFVVPWIATVPLEAALTASRRMVIVATALAIAVALGLWAAGAAGMLPPRPVTALDGATLGLLGALSAALYAGAVTLGTGALARLGERVKLHGESRYRLLAQNMTEMITRHGRNGAVTFVSPAAERMLGVPGAGLLAHGLFDRVHVADRPAFLTAISDAARYGRTFSVEYRVRRGPLASEADGMTSPSFIWVETSCHPVEPAMGAPGENVSREVVAVTRDISRHKSDALALETARADAERANESRSRFLATVSHELRTPLNAIIGFSEMLARERAIGLDPERRQAYAKLICDSGEHLLAVVNGILDVSRIESGHFELATESFVPGPLVDRCCEMMMLHAEQAGLRFSVEIAPGLPEIVADKQAVRQVLINLISNAIKFTDRGGSVKVSARAESGALVFAVEDTGIGIAQCDVAKLGNPFFQARSTHDRSYEGAGLGLSVVKKLVHLHAGDFRIESRPGAGTRVEVRLLLTCDRPAMATAAGKVERLRSHSPALETTKVKRSA